MFINSAYHLSARFCACALLMAAAIPLNAEETACSTPCGYIQTKLYAKQTSYLGLGLHPEALMQHTLQPDNVTISGNKITIKDTEVNFNELMPAGNAYVLELVSGDEAVAVYLNRDAWRKDAPSWNADSITVEDRNVAQLLKNNKPGSYIIRKARTLNDIFGADNTFQLKSGSSVTADTVYANTTPSLQLAFYYSSSKNQWMRRGSTENMGTLPLFNHEPLQIVRKAGSDVQAFVIGEVAQKHQKIFLSQKATLLHTGLPVPQTLLSTSLQTTLPNPPGDIVYVPLAANQPLTPCQYDTSSGIWKNLNTGEDVSGVLIEGILHIVSSGAVPAYTTVQTTSLSHNPQ